MTKQLELPIKEQLKEIPTKIFNKEMALRAEMMDYEELILKQKLQEGQIKQEVMSETLDGQPKYSNEDKRKAEVSKRLKMDDLYYARTNQITNIYKKMESEKIVISYLKRQFRATLALAHLEAGDR